MKENLFRLALAILLLALFTLVARNVLAQDLKLKKFPMPEYVSLDVYPRALIKDGEVRIRWKIPVNADNTWQSLAWVTDEDDIGSSLRQMDRRSPITYEKYLYIRATTTFEACVYRLQKRHCVVQKVSVGGPRE